MNLPKNKFESFDDATVPSLAKGSAPADLLHGSAGLRPAVSQSSTLQNLRNEDSAGKNSGPFSQERPSRLQIGGTAECNSALRHRPKGAFSLIEILVTVALLSFIIIGLVAMFGQTRRAFVSSMTQADVLESGRMAADNIGREMEQISPAFSYSVKNLYFDIPTTYQNSGPLIQVLADPNDAFVNNLQEVYFVTRNNMQWSCVGYKLGSNDYTAGMGTLYRFSSNNIAYTNIPALSNSWYSFEGTDPLQSSSNFSRIIDGVVDFRVRVYDTNGMLLNSNSLFQVGGNWVTYVSSRTNTQTQTPVMDYMQGIFTSNSLPAYIDIELGVLEDRALAHYKALVPPNSPVGPGSVGWNYLTNHAAQVHIFRQRIPIRNINSSAFP